jgi:hypothetical protein
MGFGITENNFKQIVRKLLRSCKKSGWQMFLKTRFHMCLTTWVPSHKDIGKIEQCYQESYDPVMMGDYADGSGIGR